MGAFQAIDLESQGFLEKNNFLYCVTAYINKLLTGEEMARKSQQDWNGNSRSHYQTDMDRGSPKKSLDNFNEGSKAMVGGISAMMQQGSTPNHPSSKNPYLAKDGILGQLESEFGLSLYKIYE